MQRLTLRGIHWACEIEGPSDTGTTPLVLIHGFPLDRRVWQDVAAITSATRRTIRPDLPGFGRSDGGHFTIESLAQDLHEMLRTLGALPAALAGLSMGGYVALEVARLCPGDVAALALVDSRANADDEAGKRKRDQMIKLVRRSGTHAVVDHMSPGLLSPASAGRPQLLGRLRRIMLDTPGETIAIASAAMRDRRDLRPLLAHLKMPVAVIVGEDDKITPTQTAREMAEAIPGAELTVIPQAGHLTPLERPAEVAEALGRLMRRI